MTCFVGLDASQKVTVICVVDSTGRRLWRQALGRLRGLQAAQSDRAVAVRHPAQIIPPHRHPLRKNRQSLSFDMLCIAASRLWIKTVNTG
jgi:hypothetical protein